MKNIKSAFIEIPETGECSLDIEKTVVLFDEKCFISRWHAEYRLVRKTYKKVTALKLTIKESDAKELIDRLGLQKNKSSTFINAATYGMPGCYL